jgi:hypothetical protein
MKTPQLVAPSSASNADRPPRDLAVPSRETAQAGQTAWARMLDEAFVWNLKEFGYGG